MNEAKQTLSVERVARTEWITLQRTEQLNAMSTQMLQEMAVALEAALTDDAGGEADEIPVMGRVVAVPKAAKGVARFEFSDLCEKPLGVPDYLAIAKAYHTVVLANVPLLTAATTPSSA